MPTGIVTISEYTASPPIQVDSSSTLEVRGWYTHDYISIDGVTPIFGNSTNGEQGPYFSTTPTLNGSNEIVVPAHDVQITVGANPTANYFEGLWIDGAFVMLLMPNTQSATGWQIPSVYGDPIAYDEIATYNRAKRLVYAPSSYFTADQTIQEIDRRAGQFMYSAVGVNGIGSISRAPAIASQPIFVSDNDTRVPPATVVNASQISAANIRAQLLAAEAALPSAGGIVDARGISGTIASTLTLSKANVLWMFGSGSIDFSSSPGIDITGNNIHLVGLGVRATNLRNLGTGATVRMIAGSERCSVSNLSIILATSSASAIGLLIKGVASGSGPVTENNYAYNIEILGNLVTSQIGLYLDGTGGTGSTITFNTFYNFKIVGVDRPVLLDSHNEASILNMFNIELFGSGALGVGAVINGHAHQCSNFWFGRNASTATELQGFSVGADSCVLSGVADLASGGGFVGYLFDFSGGNNIHSGQVLGTTSSYVKNLGNNPFFAGPLRPSSTYLSLLLAGTGADLNLSQTGIETFSNGFSIQYQDSPQAMLYTFLNGRVGIGQTPAFSGTPGLGLGSSGTVITQLRLYTPSLSPSAVNANTTAEQTFAVSGLTTDDKILYVNKPTAQAGLGIVGFRVSGADTLAITFSNNSASPITPTGSETYQVGAIRS